MKLATYGSEGERFVFTAVSGRDAVFKQMDVIANNLANMNTAGYRAEKVIFEAVMADKDSQGSSQLNTDSFVSISGSYTDLSQGAIEMTNNPYDVAIDGPGLFAVQTPDGTRYTRCGEFSRDSSGRLVTQSGHPVLAGGGEINLGNHKPHIEQNGDVVVNGEVIATLQTYTAEPGDLEREAGQLFKLKDGAAAQPVANVKVQGGALESSNVNAVRELTDMIYASRLFEALEKTEQSSGKMTQARNQIFGRQS